MRWSGESFPDSNILVLFTEKNGCKNKSCDATVFTVASQHLLEYNRNNGVVLSTLFKG